MISTLDFLITRLLGISSMAILIGQSSILSLGVLHGAGSRVSRLGLQEMSSEGSMVVTGAVHTPYVEGLMDAEMQQFVSYTPPGCSDTDSDQTNNCGPGDSTDAGTRMTS